MCAQHNPANAIMEKAIASRFTNNPQKAVESFALDSYSRLIVTANPQSVPAEIDTLVKRTWYGKKYIRIDSTLHKFKKLVTRQHLFETEKVSRLEFDGTHFKETVTGMRMSGFREPIYEILGFNLQSFSLYRERYELFGTQYNSPVSGNARSDYFYKLLDSAQVQGRKTYIIGFKNKRSRKKAGLQGELWIDAQNFAIAHARIGTSGMLNIVGIHQFNWLPSRQIWFPSGREFTIRKGNNDEDIRILGGTIRFQAGRSDVRDPEPTDFTYLRSITDFAQISVGQPVSISKKYTSIEVPEAAIGRTDSFFERYRRDTLDVRQANTYRALDSIVARERIETKLRFGRKIINGYVPFGPVDLDLRYLLSFNNYEGFRLGTGGVTNDRFSKKFRIEGYSAYGTKDGKFKYHLGAATRIGKYSNTWIGGSYTDDIREIASTSFTVDKRVFKLYDPRPINVSTFYHHITWRGFIETRLIPKTESIWQLQQTRIEPLFGYVFRPGDESFQKYDMTLAQASVQWNPFSDFMQTPSGRVEYEKRFPKFTFQFTHSVPEVAGNDFSFGKIDLRAEYEKRFLNGQRSSVLIEGGHAFGDAPLTHLYNTSPNNLTRDRLLQRVTFAGKNAFETMYFNEFFSSQYAMLQLKHSTGRLAISKSIAPRVVFVTRMAWGDLQRPWQHQGIAYKTLDKGYYESGFELNQIFKGLGLTAFYRYGPNQLTRLEDTLALKVSFLINLGL